MRNKHGVTLVELIVVLGVMSIVLTIAFSLNLFGVRVFNKGDALSDVQFDVRMSSDFIFSEVRNAAEISLSMPTSPDDYDQIYVESNQIKYKPAGGSVVQKTGAIIQNPSTDFLVSLTSEGSSYMLIFTIIGNNQQSTFSLSTDVLLNNIKSASLMNNQSVIYYKKAQILETEPPVETSTPTPTPIAPPTPTPDPGVIPELQVEILSEFSTNQSVTLKFLNNIISNEILTDQNFNITHTAGEDILVLTMNSGDASNGTGYFFNVVDEFNIEKKVTVYYRNNGHKWDVVQLSEP